MVDSLKTRIMKHVEDFPGTSFAELGRMEGFKGDLSLASISPKHSNIVFWAGMSREAIDAIQELLDQERIELRPTHLLTYAIDGVTLNLPLARRWIHYKNPRWAPVTLYLKTIKKKPARKRTTPRPRRSRPA